MILKQRSNVPGIVLWLAEQYSRNHSSTFLLNFLQCFLSEDYKRWTAPPLQQISNLLSFLLPCDWSEIKVKISGRCIEVILTFGAHMKLDDNFVEFVPVRRMDSPVLLNEYRLLECSYPNDKVRHWALLFLQVSRRLKMSNWKKNIQF